MKTQILGLYALMALFLVNTALAGSYENIRVDHVNVPYYDVYGNYYPVRVFASSASNRVPEDIHVRSWMPTFSDRAYGMMNDLSGLNPSRTIIQPVPVGLPKGEYLVRVTISNDDERRVKHRLVYID